MGKDIEGSCRGLFLLKDRGNDPRTLVRIVDIFASFRTELFPNKILDCYRYVNLLKSTMPPQKATV
jgi:hypothetical protein